MINESGEGIEKTGQRRPIGKWHCRARTLCNLKYCADRTICMYVNLIMWIGDRMCAPRQQATGDE